METKHRLQELDMIRKRSCLEKKWRIGSQRSSVKNSNVLNKSLGPKERKYLTISTGKRLTRRMK